MNISHSTWLLRNGEMLVTLLRVTIRITVVVEKTYGERMIIFTLILLLDSIQQSKEIFLGLHLSYFLNYLLFCHRRLKKRSDIPESFFIVYREQVPVIINLNIIWYLITHYISCNIFCFKDLKPLHWDVDIQANLDAPRIRKARSQNWFRYVKERRL